MHRDLPIVAEPCPRRFDVGLRHAVVAVAPANAPTPAHDPACWRPEAHRFPVRRASRRQLPDGDDLRGGRGWTRCHAGERVLRPERFSVIGRSRNLTRDLQRTAALRFLFHMSSVPTPQTLQRQANAGDGPCCKASGKRPAQPAGKDARPHLCLCGWTSVFQYDIKIATSDRAGKALSGRNRLFFRGRMLFLAFLITEEILLAKPSGCSIDYDFNDRKKRIEWTFRSKTSTEECL